MAIIRYKGMGQSTSGSTAASKNVTPQATGGFSQIQARGGGEGGGQQMSVLLSWHEKVCFEHVSGNVFRSKTNLVLPGC